MDNSSGQTSYKHLPKKRMASHMFHASGSDSDMLDGEEYKVGQFGEIVREPQRHVTIGNVEAEQPF